MTRKLTIRALLLALLALSPFGGLPAGAEVQGTRVVLIVLDGLRPDYVRPALMPNLHRWGRNGVVFEKHHAAFPTVTRVNASSIATGAYPETHGIVDNSVYFPAVEPDKTLSTGSRENLEAINESTGGNLLTATSLGEILAAQGMKVGVFSSGSTGSAFLLNHKVQNGAIVNSGYVLPVATATQLEARLGPEPPESEPNGARNTRIVDAYLDYGLTDLDAELTILWISDPDHTAHEYGMATARTTQALRLVDDLLGRIEHRLESLGRLATTNILVTSDHGFSTHIPPADKNAVLDEFSKAHGLSDNAIIKTGSCIYVKEPHKALVPDLVAALQATPWVGPLFTRAKEDGSDVGWVPGTFSLDLVRGDHPDRAPDIVLSPMWNDDEGAMGFRGTVATGGVAGHGSASPWDIHNTLIARGPDFAQRRLVGLPTHNTDLAPTICFLLGVKPAVTMKGRVLFEGMNMPDLDPPAEIEREVIETSQELANGRQYRMAVQRSRYRGVVYFDQASATRE